MHSTMPYLGQGGREYAVTVPNKSVSARLGTRLPDPGQIFDELFLRKEFEPCPCDANGCPSALSSNLAFLLTSVLVSAFMTQLIFSITFFSSAGVYGVAGDS
jgi:hypothetical protein